MRRMTGRSGNVSVQIGGEYGWIVAEHLVKVEHIETLGFSPRLDSFKGGVVCRSRNPPVQAIVWHKNYIGNLWNLFGEEFQKRALIFFRQEPSLPNRG